MKLNKEDLALMRKENLKWPKVLKEVQKEDWSLNMQKDSPTESVLRVLRSKEFLVQVFHQRSQGNVIRMSVQRTDWDPKKQRFRDDISWDELQRLKAEAGYGDRCAVEVFPPDDRVVNVANMRHLFLLGVVPSFVWDERHFS